jgi:GNAT superfamily N-acetyltransferase
MKISIRRARPEDADICGPICFEAFNTISAAHGFPPDFPSRDVALGLFAAILSHPRVYAVVAEVEGRAIGSNMLWEDGAISGVGPITVDPTVQNSSVGRRLMEAVLEHARERKHVSTRLVQAAYHSRSLSLYAKLGFVAREPLSNIQGPPLNLEIPGYAVRKATQLDIEACNRVCFDVHGHNRGDSLSDAVQQGTATVVERDGRVTGYASVVGFFGHAVGYTNEDLKAVIGAAPEFAGPGFLLPTRNAELLRWCLEHKLRIVQPLMLMTIGLYNEPKGAFLPSVLY